MSEFLDQEEWLPLAQQLDKGQKASHEHSCGSGRKLLVVNGEAGFNAWCYRCGIGGFVPHAKPSLKERIAALTAAREADAKEQADPRPPLPANFEPASWPAFAKLWLYKAGLNNNLIKACGIYWCDRISRVVIPVVEDGKLIYWQARGFDKERAKYLNPRVDKPIYKRGDRGGLLVITEDILSAIKVSQVADAWSILGTSMPAQLPALVSGRKVAVWLDPDEAGRSGRGKLYRALSAAGIEATVIRSDEDPKMYNQDQIREFLCLS